MNKSTLESKYTKIFEDHRGNEFDHILERKIGVHYDEDEQEADILFVGINPSYMGADKDTHFFFDRTSKNPYFNALERMRDAVDKSLKWTHIDILVFKETDQKYIEELFKKPSGVEFIFKQIELAKKRLEHIKPKVILVANTKARQFMGKDRIIFKDEKRPHENVWMGLNFEFDEELGCDVIRASNETPKELEGTPVFFSSMLSGQRALDRGSWERLAWQIRRVLEMKK
jgi:uracil-DNA glycosylase